MLAQSYSTVTLVVQSYSISYSIRGHDWRGACNTGRQLKWRVYPWGWMRGQPYANLRAASLGFQTEGDPWCREPLYSTWGNNVPQSLFLWGSFHYFRSQHKMNSLWGSSEGWPLRKGWWGGWEQVPHQQGTGMLCKRALVLV